MDRTVRTLAFAGGIVGLIIGGAAASYAGGAANTVEAVLAAALGLVAGVWYERGGGRRAGALLLLAAGWSLVALSWLGVPAGALFGIAGLLALTAPSGRTAQRAPRRRSVRRVRS